MFNDYRTDRDVTPCKFTRAQLVNARAVASSVTDFDNYVPGFRTEVQREINRHDSGGCSASGPGNPAGGSLPTRRLRIVKIRPRGSLRESVTIKNVAGARVRLSGLSLRDRAGGRIRLPRKAALRPGRTLRVYTGCAKGRRRAVRRGARFFACRRRPLWDDRGDVVRLVRGGTLLARRGYGRFRRVKRN